MDSTQDINTIDQVRIVFRYYVVLNYELKPRTTQSLPFISPLRNHSFPKVLKISTTKKQKLLFVTLIVIRLHGATKKIMTMVTRWKHGQKLRY